MGADNINDSVINGAGPALPTPPKPGDPEYDKTIYELEQQKALSAQGRASTLLTQSNSGDSGYFASSLVGK